MRTITIFCILFLPNFCEAQVNYIDYHRDIIKAENLFLAGKFQQSLFSYNNCFAKYPKAFVKDIFIATQIACLQNDSAMLSFFLNEGFKKGLPWRMVENDSNISTYLKQLPKEFIIRLKNSFFNGRTFYLSNINLSLRYKILIMSQIDQLYHEFPRDISIPINRDSLYATILDANMDSIMNVIYLYGYPGEHLIGINNSEDDKADCFPNYEQQLVEPTPIFFYHNECAFQQLSKQLYQSILSGDLHPREYALMYEWSFNEFRYKKDTTGTEIEMDGEIIRIMPTNIPIKPCKTIQETERYGIDKSIQSFNNAPVNDNKINADRAKIGIASISHDRLKKDFEKKYHVKLFFGMFGEL
ncbi:MAG: hypothetical protein JST52_06655 [Bacteroidetes bacterium]|nr:hypothetical protein [Bacteroidota bacterium]